MTDNKQNISYSWKPLTDLPDDWKELHNPELYSLANIWAEQRSQLKESRYKNKEVAGGKIWSATALAVAR